jgi:hypothetical protein
MSFIFKVIARNPPMALFVIGAFLIVYGTSINDLGIVQFGKQCFQWGVILQFAWIGMKVIRR